MWAFSAGIYVGKIQGLKDVNFDQERANLKLQQCQEVIIKGKLYE
jgi:hypothetical protein